MCVCVCLLPEEIQSGYAMLPDSQETTTWNLNVYLYIQKRLLNIFFLFFFLPRHKNNPIDSFEFTFSFLFFFSKAEELKIIFKYLNGGRGNHICGSLNEILTHRDDFAQKLKIKIIFSNLLLLLFKSEPVPYVYAY